jgi:hypothetical protein
MLRSVNFVRRYRWFHVFAALAAFHLMGEKARVAMADDAATLVARVLATNSPWLNPAPASGTYSLLRQPDGAADETTGPFDFESLASNGWQFCQPYRVGSMVWTPLHSMAATQASYTLGPLGSTNLNGLNLNTVDVTFDPGVRGCVGMGGQGDTSYTEGTYPVQAARLFIEPSNAIPIFMVTMTSSTNQIQYGATWLFDPFFYSVDGGLAPRAFDWNEPNTFHERQEFQVVGNTWVFKRGDGWWPSNPAADFGMVGHIQSLELINLSLGLALPMIISKSGTHLNITLLGTNAGGFGVEAADGLDGPWSPVASQMSPDDSIVTVAMPTNRPAQFYRLSK